jgi:hypothetical protein
VPAEPGPGTDTKPKHAGGRPRIIETPEELDIRVAAYLEQRSRDKEPVTLTGLILTLGLSSRESFERYGERPEFSDAVKRARLAVEADYERRLDRDRPTGSIFALKNMGWSDQQTLNVRGGLAMIDYSRLRDDQLARIAAGEHPLAVLASEKVRALPAGPADPGTPSSKEGEKP